MSTERKVCILVASGFTEQHITEMQRALTRAKISFKIVAPEQGLVNGWQGEGWGHYHTVDSQIGATMGSDYDGLVLVGGERAMVKLKPNLHTRRILNHFLEAEKPIAAIGEAVGLLTLSPLAAGLTVAAPESVEADLKAAQIERSQDAQVQDRMVLTSDGTTISTWVEAALILINSTPLEVADIAA